MTLKRKKELKTKIKELSEELKSMSTEQLLRGNKGKTLYGQRRDLITELEKLEDEDL